MEAIGVVLVLAVIIGVSIFLSYLRKQARRALNRGIFERGNHARGQAITTEAITFSAPVAAQQILDAVRARLALPTEAPGAFIARLYLAADKPGVLVFAFGNKISQTFRSALTAENVASGSKGDYRVLNWVEGDGIVRGIPEMELLANTIRGVASELGGTYGSAVGTGTASASPPAAAPAPEAASVGSAPLACPSCGSLELGVRFCTECGVQFAA